MGWRHGCKLPSKKHGVAYGDQSEVLEKENLHWCKEESICPFPYTVQFIIFNTTTRPDVHMFTNLGRHPMGEWELLCHHSFDLSQILTPSLKWFWTYMSKSSFPEHNGTHWNSDKQRSPSNLNRENQAPRSCSFQDSQSVSHIFQTLHQSVGQ